MMIRWHFKDDLEDVSVYDDLTLPGRLYRTDGAAKRKRSLTKRVSAHRRKTEICKYFIFLHVYLVMLLIFMQHKYVVGRWGARGRGEASNFFIGGSCHKYNFCRDKRSVVATRVFRDKRVFFSPKHVFCCDKSMLVATSIFLSRQNFYCDRYLSR